MKIAALWDMTPCILAKYTNVSDDLVASIMTAKSSEM
jgi:hypothetical protein